MAEQLQSKDNRIQTDAALRIASTFEKEGYFREAAKVYRMLGCPGDYLRCFEKFEVDN